MASDPQGEHLAFSWLAAPPPLVTIILVLPDSHGVLHLCPVLLYTE